MQQKTVAPPTLARRALTLIETLTASGAAAMLLAGTVALTAESNQQAHLVGSQTNLRTLGIAAHTYAAEWNDRQLTLVNDDLSRYGTDAAMAVRNFETANGEPHPSFILGWGAEGTLHRLDVNVRGNERFVMPISFDAKPFGWFRMLNVKQFNQYLGGRFFDGVFYAPADTAVMRSVKDRLNEPAEYRPDPDGLDDWSSYCWSAAALMHPDVLGRDGFKHPLSIDNGLRVPSMAQTRYPNLKTHIIEHDWLQNRPAWAAECRAGVERPRYGGCEPHTFNHYAYSQPNALFFDGHVEPVLMADLLDDNRRVGEAGAPRLWHDTPGGAIDGYYGSGAVDPTRAAPHVFTTDGIRGRDMLPGRPTRGARPASRPVAGPALDDDELSALIERLESAQREISHLHRTLDQIKRNRR